MLTTPYVALDMDIMQRNIIAMTSGLARHNIQHWPHIKTINLYAWLSSSRRWGRVELPALSYLKRK
ncbi:TPA: hypothetical protein ACS29I_000694 [Klebsiella oxytoca]